MRMIEKLGGYQKAKEAYDFLSSTNWHKIDSKHIKVLYQELNDYLIEIKLKFPIESFIVKDEWRQLLRVHSVLDTGIIVKSITNNEPLKSFEFDTLRLATEEEKEVGINLNGFTINNVINYKNNVIYVLKKELEFQYVVDKTYTFTNVAKAENYIDYMIDIG